MRILPFMIASIGVVTVTTGIESPQACGEMHAVTIPEVAFAEAYPQEDRRHVLSVLRSDRWTFDSGTALNSFTTLRYRGNTQALNMFLDGLAKSRNVIIHVSFPRKSESGNVFAGSDWSVHHKAVSNTFHIRINLSSEQLQLEELRLPEFRS